MKARLLLDKMVRSHSEFYTDAFWSALDGRLQWARMTAVLELACGPGLFALELMRRHEVSRYALTDESRAMLRYARRHRRGSSSTTIVSCRRVDFDANDWGMPDQDFDLVFVGMAFRNARNPVQLLRQAHRLLRQGGAFVSFDFERVSMDMFRGCWERYAGTPSSDEVVADRYENFCRYTRDDIEVMLRDAGYVDASTDSVAHALPMILSSGRKTAAASG